MPRKLAERCASIGLLLTDVDGVLTDGGVVYGDGDIEFKRFHIRDGLGLRLWRESGGKCGFVTSRRSKVVDRRAAELGVDFVLQKVPHKLAAVTALCDELGMGLEQVAFVGDDLLDLGLLRAVGLGIAVADAAEEVRSAAHYVTSMTGGSGAVREVVELLLKNSGRWETVLQPYLA